MYSDTVKNKLSIYTLSMYLEQTYYTFRSDLLTCLRRGMVDDFFGVSVLRYVLWVRGIVSSNKLRIFLGQHTQSGLYGHRWQNVALNTKI